MSRKKNGQGAAPQPQPPSPPSQPASAPATSRPENLRWLGENPLFAIVVLFGFTAASAWIAHELEFCEYVKAHDLLGRSDPEFHKVWLGALPAAGITVLTAYRIRHSAFWTSLAQVAPVSAIIFALLLGVARVGAGRGEHGTSPGGGGGEAEAGAHSPDPEASTSDVWHRADGVVVTQPNRVFDHVVRLYNLGEHARTHWLCRRGGPGDDWRVETPPCVQLEKVGRRGAAETRITGVAPPGPGRYTIQYKIEGREGDWTYPDAQPVNIDVVVRER